MKPKSCKLKDCTAWVVISDTHCGCQLGLCPPKGVVLDNGGRYMPSIIQQKLWEYWEDFWKKWVPMVTKGMSWGIIHNGDIIDGRHHGATSQISQNLKDQRRIAYEILAPLIEKADGRFYSIRGTPAHVGESAEDEEELAHQLGAIPNEFGQFSRNELWKRIGSGLCHFMHHIGTSGSSAYESTGVFREMVEEFVEAGRWGEEPPSIVVRSHRHRHLEVRVPTQHTMGISFVTAGWQLKTPFAYRIAGARISQPQIGGSAIIVGSHEIYTRHSVQSLARPREE